MSEAWSEVSAVSRDFFNMGLLKYLRPLHNLPALATVQEETIVPTRHKEGNTNTSPLKKKRPSGGMLVNMGWPTQ